MTCQVFSSKKFINWICGFFREEKLDKEQAHRTRPLACYRLISIYLKKNIC